jgi:hypothetical protein
MTKVILVIDLQKKLKKSWVYGKSGRASILSWPVSQSVNNIAAYLLRSAKDLKKIRLQNLI